jgi:hypothetical protein
MSMAEQLSENSRQGFAAQKPLCIGPETDLSRNLHWGCGYVYDETPVGLAVYVRNDPVNLVDPDGRYIYPINEDYWFTGLGGFFNWDGPSEPEPHARDDDPGRAPNAGRSPLLAMVDASMKLAREWLSLDNTTADCRQFVQGILENTLGTAKGISAFARLFTDIGTWVPNPGQTYNGDPDIYATTDTATETVTLYNGFFLDGFWGQAQVVLHEMIHLVGGDDIDIALMPELNTGFQLNGRNPDDFSVIAEASLAWDRVLRAHCDIPAQ